MRGVGNGRRGGARNGRGARAAAAWAAGAALLAATAGCGGGSAASVSDGKPSAAASPTGTAANASPSAAPVGPPGPDAAALKALVLAAGAKAGPYEVDEPLLDEPFSEIYEAEPAVCLPLTTLAAAGHTAQAYASAGLPGKPLEVDTDILLRSYRDANAAGASLKSLAEAGKRCAGGYTEERAVIDAKVLRVEPVAAPAIGDEALAYRIVTQDVKDEAISLYQYLTVVRSGPVTLSFSSDVIDTKDFGGVPREIVTAQWEKFSRGAGSS
ncbi:hypothetical protein ACIPY6_10070 [Streptomyces sp. NPDC090054]|uniref:hypothetical protein n=1 Tax=Streptomyces sp. NPDC090054 TaxID=3365933 RepID=UPI0037F89919